MDIRQFTIHKNIPTVMRIFFTQNHKLLRQINYLLKQFLCEAHNKSIINLVCNSLSKFNGVITHSTITTSVWYFQYLWNHRVGRQLWLITYVKRGGSRLYIKKLRDHDIGINLKRPRIKALRAPGLALFPRWTGNASL